MTLAPWKESYDKPRWHTKIQRHHVADKGPCKSKAMFFPLVMYGCESWTVKKAECQRVLLNCGVGKNSGESLGLQGDPTSPF